MGTRYDHEGTQAAARSDCYPYFSFRLASAAFTTPASQVTRVWVWGLKRLSSNFAALAAAISAFVRCSLGLSANTSIPRVISVP